MKKLNDIKLGILIGLVLSCIFIIYKPVSEYYASANNTKDQKSLSETAKDMDYGDVFSSDTYKDLYFLVYYKALENPKDEALKTIAAAYGFSVAEAKSILDGSIEPIMTKYHKPGDSQQVIYDMSIRFVADFNEMYEMLALEQELTIGGVASEIFSNGDVSDSGFDLVYDLTLIEEIIFGTTSDASLGGPLDFGSFNDKEEATDELIASGNKDAEPNIPDVYNELNKAGDIDDEESDDETETALEVFDPTELVKVQDEDICPKPETEIESALDDFKTTNPDNVGTVGPEPAPKEKPEISPEAEKIAEKNPDSLLDVLIPEPADDWSDKPKCNGFFYSLKGNTDEGRVTQEMTGEDESTLVGKPENSDTEPKSETPDDGKPDAPGSGIAAEFFICLEATTKWAKYGTVIPNKPCIKCETEKIIAYLNKTLENSFVPNKVTGNFLEPSKCKSAFSSAIDIKFNLIWTPIQTPRKDDSNKLKSLSGEWNKLVSRSNPLLLPEVPMTSLDDHINATAATTAQQNASEAASYAELMNEVNSIKETFSKQAAEGENLFSTISKGENFVTYSQDVMKEVDQMTNYFRNFNNIFTKLADETCPNILKKPKVK